MGHEEVQNTAPAVPGSNAGGPGPDGNDQVSASLSPSRIEINTKNATRHGYYSREKKLTTRTIEQMFQTYRKHDKWLLDEGHTYHDFFARPPMEEICEEWRDDPWLMVDYVIAHHGLRISRNQYLVRRDESQPWSPENVQGWEFRPPRMTRGQRRAALARDPLGALLDCACDHRAQSSCARSSRPCDWAAAARDEAPWTVPPPLPS